MAFISIQMLFTALGNGYGMKIGKHTNQTYLKQRYHSYSLHTTSSTFIRMASAVKSHIPSVKDFIESNDAVSIPSTYYSVTELREDVADDKLAASIPVIDFSLLTSDDPHVHVNAVRQLGSVCREWGFFMIINHGISEKLMKDLLNKSVEFHNLSFEEKKDLANEELITPIRYGTSALPHGEKVHYWRDYLKVETHPNFNFPHKPPGFSYVQEQLHHIHHRLLH